MSTYNPVRLSADLVEVFAGGYLSPRYDDPQPTPAFHRQCWQLYCSPHPQCMVVAPRGHAKSTGLTFAYILAEVCFRTADYVILLGSTEEMAAELLSNLREELAENDDLRRDFGISSFEREAQADIIVRCDDGHRFRILARGAEQKIRGKMWNGKRPNLLVCDDMEDDEQVENKDRRKKFSNWFFRAAKQALSRTGRCRVHGTILHEESLLSKLRNNSEWQHLYFKAHTSFDDFSNMLWPEQWSEEKLRAKRQEFIDMGDAAGYSQEWLNEPADTANPFLRREDFLPMVVPEDFAEPMLFGCGVDFAVSKKDKANRTSFTVGGRRADRAVCIVDQRVGRLDSLEIIEEFFSVDKAWSKPVFFPEDGQIWKAISPMLDKEMQRRGVWLNLSPRPAISDKATRARPFQRVHRARGMRFDKTASWYPGYEEELLKFRVEAEATLDDQFDSTAHLCAGFEAMPDVEVEDFTSDEELEFEEESRRLRSQRVEGRSSATGY